MVPLGNRHSQVGWPDLRAILLGIPLAPVVLLAACSGTAARQPNADSSTTVSRPTSTAAPTASPVAAATLPPLTLQQGWQAVLVLGEAGSSTSSSGSFTASAPYMLYWACEGTGTLKVTYGDTTQTMDCAAQSQLQGSGQQTPNPIGQQVAVSAAGQGDVAWEVLVEMQG